MQATADTLTSLVEFDRPFRITEQGEVMHDVPNEHAYWAPELFNVVEPKDFMSDTWELVNGYSGQDSYSGPIMHDSEYLGGQMAQDVLDTPGIYCLVLSYYDNEECKNCNHTQAVHGELGDDEGPSCSLSHCGCVAFQVNEAEYIAIEGWALAHYIGDGSRSMNLRDSRGRYVK